MPPSSIFVIWMIGLSGSVARGAGEVDYKAYLGGNGFLGVGGIVVVGLVAVGGWMDQNPVHPVPHSRC